MEFQASGHLGPFNEPVGHTTSLLSHTRTMNDLPIEVKCMIAFNLRNCDANPHGPRDIKQLRLINKAFSDAGAEHLLPEIHLTFQSQSFKRLRTISEHPIYSQHVKSLQYDPNTFGEYHESYEGCYEGWVKGTDEMSFIGDCRPFGEVGKEDEGDCPQLVGGSELEGIKAETLERYKSYQAVCSDQMSIRSQEDRYNFGLVVQAVARLPKLAEVTLNFEHGAGTRSNAFKRAYAETLYIPRGDDGHRCPYGLMQLCSVLVGVASAGTKLKSLDCGKISWEFLELLEGIYMRRIEPAFKHLDSFRITLHTGQGYLDYRAFLFQVYDCYQVSRKHQMCELLSAAKDLKTLSFCTEETDSIDLDFIVGTTTWASLRIVELDTITTGEDQLIEFLKRHGGTLKELGLNNIKLAPGDWTLALPRIRDAAKLDEFRAVGSWWAGSFFSALIYQCWAVDTSWDSARSNETTLSQAHKLGIAVNRYVLKGGDCPLPDTTT
ncbi:hypothetical protein HO173_009088 [Letharia columbiana]|uniref:Uncharacterized protein n=1 Tax=Letharia columbiana TaxID=112416 RepID=A0A8H6FQ46_9LECA|nr:uncharacterized protein HO173_009088 [Letharia columbiana]KAF6232649.1 hypothetical protein HO173_009088 [Letharia columbiana]